MPLCNNASCSLIKHYLKVLIKQSHNTRLYRVMEHYINIFVPQFLNKVINRTCYAAAMHSGMWAWLRHMVCHLLIWTEGVLLELVLTCIGTIRVILPKHMIKYQNKNISYQLVEAWWGISKLNHHWFRWWLVSWSPPSRYLNKCWNWQTSMTF